MITITISTYFGRNMNMNWYPKKKDGKPLSEKDVRSVIHYISNGEWEMPVSSAARNAYKELASCVAKQLVDDIRGDYAKFKEVCMPVYVAYLHNELPPTMQNVSASLKSIVKTRLRILTKRTGSKCSWTLLPAKNYLFCVLRTETNPRTIP